MHDKSIYPIIPRQRAIQVRMDLLSAECDVIAVLAKTTNTWIKSITGPLTWGSTNV